MDLHRPATSDSPAQRRGGGVGGVGAMAARIIVAGLALALAMAAGAAWGEKHAAPPTMATTGAASMDAYYDRIWKRDHLMASSDGARAQKLWQGALSRSLARKLVHKQAAGAANPPANAPSAPAALAAKPAAVKTGTKTRTKAAKSKHAPASVAEKDAADKKALLIARAKHDALARSEGSNAKLFDEFVSESKDILSHTPASQELALKAMDVHRSESPTVTFWDKQLKKVAMKHLADKALLAQKDEAATPTPAGKAGREQKGTLAAQGHRTVQGAAPAKAKGPPRGSQAWEREQDSKFFDSLGKDSNGQKEERKIRKIKNAWERRNAEHQLREKEEEAKVHAEDEMARRQQREAELAAKKYTTHTFKDMDKQLSHINSDSVSGFKQMEAKELASEVERDHPNESAAQIAARAMKLLQVVMKGRAADPQVAASSSVVSATGPMGVAPQVGM